jgi:hypothetical protein
MRVVPPKCAAEGETRPLHALPHALSGADRCPGKDGGLTGADRESQEIFILALRLPQSALVHVDTLLQELLKDPKWANAQIVTPADGGRARCPACCPRCTAGPGSSARSAPE